MMVFLDVVYNHFGPEGNFLGRYAPSFFTDANTPWGSAIDYRVPEVRAFAIQNAVYWLRHYRFDGLRLDAVNSIVEPGEISILHDISVAVGKLAQESGRHIHLVIENSDNRASLLDAEQDPPKGKYRGQWNDDYHHAWHVLLTREEHGYYGDYQRSPLGDLARALGSGYVYQGEVSPFWGKKRGEPGGHLSPTCFINFLQNHDQVGNRPFAERLDSLAEGDAINAALAITLLSPMIPMLFMGEEWGAKEPFPFFCDFKGELADAVRKGRRAEYEWAYRKYGEEVPDPLDPATFRSALLNWNERDSAPGRKRLALVRELLSTRKREIAPRLPRASFSEAMAEQNGLVRASWRLGDGARLMLTANLSAREIACNSERATGTPIWGGEIGDRLRPWSVFWRIGG
jgi:maltooligosyltrehalose trehalohydrolase